MPLLALNVCAPASPYFTPHLKLSCQTLLYTFYFPSLQFFICNCFPFPKLLLFWFLLSNFYNLLTVFLVLCLALLTLILKQSSLSSILIFLWLWSTPVCPTACSTARAVEVSAVTRLIFFRLVWYYWIVERGFEKTSGVQWFLFISGYTHKQREFFLSLPGSWR